MKTLITLLSASIFVFSAGAHAQSRPNQQIKQQPRPAMQQSPRPQMAPDRLGSANKVAPIPKGGIAVGKNGAYRTPIGENTVHQRFIIDEPGARKMDSGKGKGGGGATAVLYQRPGTTPQGRPNGSSGSGSEPDGRGIEK